MLVVIIFLQNLCLKMSECFCLMHIQLGLTKQICRLSSPFFQYFTQAGGHYSLFIGQFLSLKQATPINKRVWHPACESQRLICGQSLRRDCDKSRLVCQFLLAKLNTMEKQTFLALAMLKNTRFCALLHDNDK